MKHVFETLYGSVEVAVGSDGDLFLIVNGEAYYLESHEVSHVYDVLIHKKTGYMMWDTGPALKVAWDDDTGLAFQTYRSHNIYSMRSALLSNEEAQKMRAILEEVMG